jgi:hypothetical protein
MTDTLKVLGQLIPAAGVTGDLYIVPALTSTVVTCVVVCNQSNADTTFRISLSIAGAALATKQYLVYDLPISGNDVWLWADAKISMATTDVLRVSSASGSISFNCSGLELT